MSKKKFPPKDFVDQVVMLYERWQKEKDADDPEDYLKTVQQEMPTATKMTKKPFGFIYDESGKVYYSAVKAIGKKLIVETFEIGFADTKPTKG